jgi:putative hemolysin
MLFETIIILSLILLNGFFSMAELAVISSRRARLQAMAEEGSRGARAALALADDSSRFLSAVQIGITLIGILAGAFGGATLAVDLAEVLVRWEWLAPYAPEAALGLVVAVITLLSLVIGELVPKQLALNNAERIASWVAIPMVGVARVAAPAVHLLDASTRAVLRLFATAQPEPTVTEDEIKMLISEATAAGVVEHAERAMISGVMRLGDLPVQALMTPRPDIKWIDLDDDRETNLRRLRESRHSRFPVARGELDELVGVLQAKDLLDACLDGKAIDLAEVREALVVPEGADALQLLELLKRNPMHLALVVDEYGSVQGLVTATDLMEAIVGGLAEEGVGGEAEVTLRDDGSWLMDGSLGVTELKEILGLKALPDEGDYHTLAGFMLTQLAHVPSPGEHVEWMGTRFEVVDMDGHRIDKVLVSRLPEPPEQTE